MDQVTISPDFTLEIPLQACEQAGFNPKQVLELIDPPGRTAIVPARTVPEWRGFLKGRTPSGERLIALDWV